MTECKTARLTEVKTSEDRPGYFKALVSVFGNVDDGGDRVVKGAFAQDIKDRGGVYPVVWSHDWGTPPIGVTKSAEETDQGLVVEAELFIDSHPLAQQVYAGLKGGAPLEFSFAYDVTEAAYVKEGDVEIRELRGLKAHEVGPTLIGMNRDTQLLAVKNAELRTEHAKHTLSLMSSQDVVALLKSVIADAPDPEPEAPTSPPAPSDGETPPDPDPADAGSSDNAEPSATEAPGLSGAEAAEVARHLATPV